MVRKKNCPTADLRPKLSQVDIIAEYPTLSGQSMIFQFFRFGDRSQLKHCRTWTQIKMAPKKKLSHLQFLTKKKSRTFYFFCVEVFPIDLDAPVLPTTIIVGVVPRNKIQNYKLFFLLVHHIFGKRVEFELRVESLHVKIAADGPKMWCTSRKKSL